MSNRKRVRAGLTLVLAVLALGLTLFAVHGLWRAPADETAVGVPTAADAAVPGPRGTDIPVSYCLPAAPQGAPLVVMCHGFTGNRQLDGHAANLAQDLAGRGVASLRLDLPGHGESREPTTAYTLANCAADIDACIDWMADKFGVNGQALALVGHSMGGRIVTEYLNLGAHAGAVKALALWSPADGDGLRGLEFLNVGGFASVEAWREEARTVGAVRIERWGGFALSEAMFAEMEASHPAETLQAFAGPVLLCYAPDESAVFTEEYTVQPTIAAVQTCVQSTVPDRDTFAGGGHNYTAADYSLPEEEAAALNAQLDETLRAVTLPVLLGALGAASKAQ